MLLPMVPILVVVNLEQQVLHHDACMLAATALREPIRSPRVHATRPACGHGGIGIRVKARSLGSPLPRPQLVDVLIVAAVRTGPRR